MRQILDFALISMFGLRETENHTPTPNSVVFFNWTGSTKR